MWHPYADLLRKHRMIACYHRTELEPTPGITWLVNDAFGDWRHQYSACGKMGTLLYLEDDLLTSDSSANNSVAISHLNEYRNFTYETDRTNKHSGPAVHRRGLGDWGAPTVFWNNGSTCSIVSPTITEILQEPGQPSVTATNPLGLTDSPGNNQVALSMWYKLTDSGLVLDEDGDGVIDAESFSGRLFELKNFTLSNTEPSSGNRWYMWVDLSYTKSSTNNYACVTIEATVTNKPEALHTGDTVTVESDVTAARHVGSLTNNDWHNLVVSFDSGRLTMYVDSKLIDASSPGGADIPNVDDWHPRCRINRSFDSASFDGIPKIAIGPVALYNNSLDQWSAYRLWASMLRPLDMAIEGHLYNTGSGPSLTPPDPDPGWTTTGPNPGGWKKDGRIDAPHTFTGRRAEYRGDNRWIEMRQSIRWYADYSWHVPKFRGRDDYNHTIYNQDGNGVEFWDGCIQNPDRGFETSNPAAVNAVFFFDYNKYHIGFHLDIANYPDRGMFMLLGIQHYAHWEQSFGTPGVIDHRQGPVAWFDNWANAGGLNYPNALDLCNNGASTGVDGGGSQPHRGIKFLYDETDGWKLRWTGHGGTPETADMDEEVTSNITMIPNLYNAVIMGSSKTCRVIRQGYNTRSGVMKASLHENDDIFNNGNNALPLDAPTSRQEEFHQYLDTTSLRSTPGFPATYGAAEEPTFFDVGQDGDLGTSRRAYDFDRVGPLAYMMLDVPQGAHERVLRVLQGQHTMRSRPGLRSPLRHVHLTAPTRVTK